MPRSVWAAARSARTATIHLGQTLHLPGGHGWLIIDFEGEPARPLYERRFKASPLRDVAGMLRSFAYATSAVAIMYSHPAPGQFEDRARQTFLEHYFATIDPALLPGGESAILNLLSIFELEKAIYELQYELDNRPDWLPIPVGRYRPTAGVRMSPTTSELDALANREHPEPHAILGAHPADDGAVVIRVLRPAAESVSVKPSKGRAVALEQIHPAGIFEGEINDAKLPLRYKLKVDYGPGGKFTLEDPYAFLPTLGELDLHLIGEGHHEQVYEKLGAHVREHQGVTGTAFAVWAPAARAVSVVGDFNSWDGRLHPMRSMGLGRDLGAVSTRYRRGRPLQVRDPRRRRRGPAQGRSLRPGDRGAAQDSLGDHPAAPRVVRRRRRVSRTADPDAAARPTDVDL